MLSASGEVLYVGKAKNLKKRVSSYFQKTGQSPRIALMLTQVAHVDITATRSEAEALILENTLIKRLAPKYNILFRDDKSYPYIVLTGDSFPRLTFHRGTFKPGDHAFGPYPNSQAVREAIQLLQKTFLLRTCENAVFAHRSRPCLLYQIKRCKAPCVAGITAEAYRQDVAHATAFLRGQHDKLIDRLTQDMHDAAERLRFEDAAQLRDQIRALQAVLHRQYVSSTGAENVDILVAQARDGELCVNLAMVRNGQHLGDRASFPQAQRTLKDWTGEEAQGLQAFIEQHYLNHPPPTRLIVNHAPGEASRAFFEAAKLQVSISLPQNEMERAWLGMAENNARLAIEARRHAAGNARHRLEALTQALKLDEPPVRIECFDISHTQGEGTVASCVVCVEGVMKKSDYRRFNITGIQPGDDYAAMRQAISRRYEKIASGETTTGLPDLVLIDGGRGQLGVAREVFAELGLQQLASIGVAKGESRKPGLETLILGEDNDLESLGLPAHHPALHLIQEIRDESHRFALFGHRAKRDKARSRSRLEDINGIGPQRRRKLLASFGGLQGVRAATVEDLCRVEGISRALAQKIYDGLH